MLILWCNHCSFITEISLNSLWYTVTNSKVEEDGFYCGEKYLFSHCVLSQMFSISINVLNRMKSYVQVCSGLAVIFHADAFETCLIISVHKLFSSQISSNLRIVCHFPAWQGLKWWVVNLILKCFHTYCIIFIWKWLVFHLVSSEINMP
jgi:hypothetical protein